MARRETKLAAVGSRRLSPAVGLVALIVTMIPIVTPAPVLGQDRKSVV